MIPAKTVVLTFDDAVKSHRTFVGPMLRELGFQATFFVTHRWMGDTANFMNWNDIAELHQMGFEIGNHTWSHAGSSTALAASRLAGEIALVEHQLRQVKVPRPTSFAWPGNGFGPEAVRVLREVGIRLARRGGMPEVEYGRATVGPAYVAGRRHRLLIPTTGDSYPNWTANHFRDVISRAVEGQAVVLQFHGVPDVAHPWVHTPPDLFRQYMQALKEGGYRVVALRDLEPYAAEPADPLLDYRHPLRPDTTLPVEVAQTRQRLDYWRSVAAAHGFTREELSRLTGIEETGRTPPVSPSSVLPYPGVRHPRTGFLDGAVSPQRGTKASVFLPWDPSSYIVVDLPEAIISSKGIHFLAHTHIPTIWDNEHQYIANSDWIESGRGLKNEWRLPDGVTFGAVIQPVDGGADMELWLRNGSAETLSRLRAQVCVMLKGARGFDAQSNGNKQLAAPRAVAASQGRSISIEWEPCHRVWANPPCPCMHSDPSFPDCAPGERVRAAGRLRMS